MIVSASYRTDIPAFHGDWFQMRLRAGYCLVASPYGGKPYRVALTAEAVDGFVFWTRNAGPFLPALEEVQACGMPFIVQYTATGYGRALERATLPAEGAIAQMRTLADVYGRRSVVWRYDPILFAGGMDADWHRANFRRMAAALAGTVDEAVVSILSPYRKAARNLNCMTQRTGLAWQVPGPGQSAALLADLAEIAEGCGMRLTLCAQPDRLTAGVSPAACIDAARLSDVAGRDITARTKGNRPGCLCAESRDIGAYDTCPHGCAYCYAVADHDKARRAHRAHDPAAESLSPMGM
ncbi:DUF1848 domain-containing protein [Oceanibaculum indicum]|uniref:Uncharacterized protein DUF1848 n=1 Tax=Oceanibaculum indicum TaxID=526216 RepID=A0A420WCB9_9PROT|nr:DUF1848 domain-containing protein [Oceanibaculum indicum]RKQ68679.1 uncharacterized protein DUF1848 [Oceanibaculum indicum]